MSGEFFDEIREQSQVKATIVSKYFIKWAMIMINTAKSNEKKYRLSKGKIAYLDLFAGPGRYKEGSASTPLLVLEKAIENDDLCERLVTMFNDKDNENVQSLQTEINTMPGIEKLTYKPVVTHKEVGTEIVGLFEQMNMIPTLFFVDPFGYKGLSLKLINSVLKNWGCDCIFFFNYNRINMGLSNDSVKQHMDALFEEEAEILRDKLEKSDPQERELAIVEALAQALKTMGGEYVLPFTFKNEKGSRTSHHLIFVSKDFTGYEKMKEVMAQESSSKTQGVPSLEYNAATERQPLLFELSRPLDDLEEMLLDRFAGQTLTMLEIYEQHNVGTPFIKRNYKEALIKMEESQKITASKHKKNSFADHVTVIFPPRD